MSPLGGEPLRKIVLIDDVVSAGRTLLAAATRLHERYPCADIRAVTLMRTLGAAAVAPRLVDVCHGVIRWSRGDVRREP